MAEVMVLQCDEILQILRLIAVDHHEDGDLYINCLIAYLIVRNALECYGGGKREGGRGEKKRGRRGRERGEEEREEREVTIDRWNSPWSFFVSWKCQEGVRAI